MKPSAQRSEHLRIITAHCEDCEAKFLGGGDDARVQQNRIKRHVVDTGHTIRIITIASATIFLGEAAPSADAAPPAAL